MTTWIDVACPTCAVQPNHLCVRVTCDQDHDGLGFAIGSATMAEPHDERKTAAAMIDGILEHMPAPDAPTDAQIERAIEEDGRV